MCFVIDDDRPDEIIAIEDIVCYKFMDYYDNVLRSPYRDYKYEFNQEYILNDYLRNEYERINEGYHSYTKLRVCKDEANIKHTIVRCIIPKGSRYYINNFDNQYVSDHIIIKEIIRNKDIQYQ
jgi:hypothetical protein